MKRHLSQYVSVARELLLDVCNPLLLQADSNWLYIDHALATGNFEFMVDMARAGDPHARSVVDLFALHWDVNWGGEVDLPEPLKLYMLERGLHKLGPTKRGQPRLYLYRDYLLSVAAQRLTRVLPELNLTRSKDKHGSQQNPSICAIIHNVLCQLDVSISERQVQEAVQLPPRPDDWLA